MKISIKKLFRPLAFIMALLFMTVFAAGCKKRPPAEVVDPLAVAAVTLNKNALSLPIGSNEKLTATVSPDTAADQSVVWTSSDLNKVAVIDGTVTALAIGTATVTVTSVSDPTKYAECAVTVTEVYVTGVTLNKNTLSFVAGGGETLIATVAPANATNKNVTWSTADAGVATVTNGAVTGVSIGITTVRATSAADQTKYAECTVNVIEGSFINVTNIDLNKNTEVLSVGDTDSLLASVTPEEASNKNIEWTSSNEGVVAVENGLVTAIGAGTATVKAASVSNPTVFDECVYTVSSGAAAAMYNNAAFHDYKDLTNSTIEGQWPGYGIGDPFIMRYNGMYYMYVSTLDSENGVRAWKSTNLTSWTKCTGAGLDEGYVVSKADYTSRAAYAPEVYYFNGTFYMYTSPGGNGHYIYTATNPEGPFTRKTENIQMSIDGSVLIDDDEKMYFTYASTTGIVIRAMNNMESIGTSNSVITASSMGGWTEGSYILKRGDIYYLTATGNHVASDAYRISYSYAYEEDFLSAGNYIQRAASFSEGMDLPMVLETDNPHLRGLGHSSTVMGPDMDSYYLAYHNLNSSGGPNRSLNIDRITFNGALMSVTPTLYGAVAPKAPRFSANGIADSSRFTATTGKAISTQATNSVFTAEFNFQNTDAMTLVVNYEDDNNYDSVEVDLSAKTIKLFSTVAGVKTEIGAGSMTNTFLSSALHTVRYAQDENGKANVYFDNMRKIKDVNTSGAGGHIGYMYSGTPAFGFTAFSDVAGGLSDRQEVKQAAGTINANLYSPEAENSRLTGTGGVSLLSSGEYEGANMLKLGATGDYASYYVNFNKSAYWGIEITYPKNFGGKQVKISVDNAYSGSPVTVTLPSDAPGSANTVRSYLATLPIWSGINKITVESADGEVGFISFKFFESTLIPANFTHNLNTYMSTGSDYRTIWKLAGESGADGHRATAGTRQLVFIGNSTITDFTLEIKVKLVGDNGTSTAGIVFRAGNYAASQHDSYNSMQGYYLAIAKAGTRLSRLNYDNSNDTFVSNTLPANTADTWITFKIVARGNNIKVFRNDSQIMNVNDGLAFTHGRIGLYTTGAEACFKDLVITP